MKHRLHCLGAVVPPFHMSCVNALRQSALLLDTRVQIRWIVTRTARDLAIYKYADMIFEREQKDAVMKTRASESI